MKCIECQSDNREGVKFCEECGAKIEVSCPNCGSKIPIGKKFCGDCGHNLTWPLEAPSIVYSEPQSYTPQFLADKILTNRSSVEGERKLVTVLFADVANYTSMAEKLDPEEVHHIMDGCFKIFLDEIHHCEGTINQFTGDGVMAIFGAPVAHEEHAQRACHAALCIQNALRDYSESLEKRFGLDFKMRIGLNSGPVVVGAIGDDLRMDYTAIGDTTNLAARMQSIAEPGNVLVSEYTHKLARNFFDFESLGEMEVKGKDAAQQAHQLLKAKEVKTRIQAAVVKGLTRFVGRAREMQALIEACDKARAGSGQVVGVVGEAGVGKSRLLLQMKNILPNGEYTYLEGRCLHYGGSMAYLPMLDILRAYFDIEEGDRELSIKEKLEDKILQLNERLRSTLPPLQELLSLQVDDKKYLQLEPGMKKLRIFEALRDLLVRESQNRPLIIAVEDLHWIDQLSQEFIDYLIGWMANARILLIVLYRPEYTHQWGSKSYYNRIGLDHLSAESSAALVQAILEGGEVVPELRDLVRARAGGNPLFVEEFTHTLLENGSIQRKGHQYVLAREASEIDVPDTIQGVIAARIDRVDDSLKRIMQMASVIGREFAFRILQTVMGMREELKSDLLNLQGLEFISEKRLFPELEYIFKHALIQEVAYGSLLQKRRREIHEKIGEAIESIYPDRLEEYYELLAYHYGRSDNRDKAVEYLHLANRKAERVHAVQEAKGYFDEAMKLLDAMPENEMNHRRRVSLIIDQIMVFELILDFGQYYEHLTSHERVAVSLGDEGLLGTYWARMGHCEWSFGQYDKAEQTLTRAVELLEACGNVEEAGYAYMLMQWNHLSLSNLEEVISFKDPAIRMLEQGFHLRWYVWVFCPVAWAYTHLGQWENALREGKEALRVSEEYQNDSLIAFSHFVLSSLYTAKNDIEQAIEHAYTAVSKAPTPGDKAWSQEFLALALARGGEPRKGLEILAELVPILRGSGFEYAAIWGEVHLCEVYWRLGEYDKARKALEELEERTQRMGMRYWRGWGQRLQGEVALETDPDQAARHFEKSIAIHQEIKAENELALAYAGYGRLHKQQGNIEQAREYLNKALEIFERLGTLVEPDKVRNELAELREE